MRHRNNRPGRPTGPTEGREQRPWDPITLTRKQRVILAHVAANPGAPRWRIAERVGISLTRLSVLTCCPVGQEFLDKLTGVPSKQLDSFRIDSE